MDHRNSKLASRKVYDIQRNLSQTCISCVRLLFDIILHHSVTPSCTYRRIHSYRLIYAAKWHFKEFVFFAVSQKTIVIHSHFDLSVIQQQVQRISEKSYLKSSFFLLCRHQSVCTVVSSDIFEMTYCQIL